MVIFCAVKCNFSANLTKQKTAKSCMELKATSLGKHLAQHPYNQVRLLTAGVEVKGENHEYIIPFNQLLSICCKRGLIWGELEFHLPNEKVVRLHGTEWNETQCFYHYVLQKWQKWSIEMSDVSAQVLQQLVDSLQGIVQQDCWLKRCKLSELKTNIRHAFAALPLPIERLEAFDNCRELYQHSLQWLKSGEEQLITRNREWCSRIAMRHADFFNKQASSALDSSQMHAVVNGEETLLTLGGAGSGKTSVLVARVGWLLMHKQATSEQIVLLVFGQQVAEKINLDIERRLQNKEIKACTFQTLALNIIEQSGKKPPNISRLETDEDYRKNILITAWRKQCFEKKAYAKGWRQWLFDEMAWPLTEERFWENEDLAQCLVCRLECWLELIRLQGVPQKAIIASAPDDQREPFAKCIKLMDPLLKTWKNTLKEEDAVDVIGLINQAMSLIDKGHFISPWKHILIDNLQDISAPQVALLKMLRKHNKQTTLFAVGDDQPLTQCILGAKMTLTATFYHHFGEGEHCRLNTIYRFNQRIHQIANQFVPQISHQLPKPTRKLTKDNKKSIVLLPEGQLEALLNKISGYATSEDRVLLLARYPFLRPDILDRTKTRWPRLKIDFMTIHASKGQQADFVIILGLQQSIENFSAVEYESVLERVLQPQDDFYDAAERQLAYVALTRAKQRVWMLYQGEQPSSFVESFKRLGVPILRKA